MTPISEITNTFRMCKDSIAKGREYYHLAASSSIFLKLVSQEVDYRV